MAKKFVKYSVVDAFTQSPFKGNPAAVCFLEEEREDEWLQAVAAEFNISETCYLTRIADSDASLTATSNPRFRLRWFTPVTEVKLCGHATLAAAYTLFSSGLVASHIIEFVTLSGVLTAKKIPEINITTASNLPNGENQDGYFIELDFPVDPTTEFDFVDTSQISEALDGATIIDIKRTTIGDDILVILTSGKSVAELKPQLDAIVKCPGRGIIVTGAAPSESGFDFYSRFFCPKFGISEDPVCGSAHCSLVTYWSKKLGKIDFNAYQVDAFTDSPFKGNPAAVCLLEEEREDEWLQAVATEFNVSETCYLTRIADSDVSTNCITANSNPRFRLRWFTPVLEVKLCGHATLAAAHTLFSSGLVASHIIEFVTLSGVLTAKKIPEINITTASNLPNDENQDGYVIELNFPVDPTTEFKSVDTSQISEALDGAPIIDIKRTTIDDDLLVVVTSGKSVAELKPQFDAIVNCPATGIIVTGDAPSESGFDFYSRYFCPKSGINEDPVTGSAHCALVTYWSKKLGKFDFNAYQASPRGGVLNIHLDEENQRVLLRGKAVTVMEGRLLV
ncbi:putative isomerase [Senna tora]|uniref:Putative isomerase n=1 Tax=Senna tora TaxID=362788 RepID=A0A834SWE2_9FABA|nr:putative isomerase [Senna tora]